MFHQFFDGLSALGSLGVIPFLLYRANSLFGKVGLQLKSQVAQGAFERKFRVVNTRVISKHRVAIFELGV